MIDRRELEDLEREYIEIALADLTDDVTCDIDTIRYRDSRMGAIQDLVGTPMTDAWTDEVLRLARESGYASGKPFED